MDIERILEKRDRLNENRHRISVISLDSYDAAFELLYDQQSTALDGNSFTLIEAKVLLEEDITVGGKTIGEHFQLVNHRKAREYVKSYLKYGLREFMIDDIYRIVTDSLNKGGVEIKTDFLANIPETLNPIELAAWTHAEFVRIHPFIDGNGRTARLLMNYQLLAQGLLPVSIAKEARIPYFDALDSYAADGSISPFAELIAELEEARLDDYLTLIH